MLVQLALEQDGWEVDLARDGRVALASARLEHDVLLVDLGLPDMDGETFVAALRAEPSFARLPVIWFTASREDGMPPGGIGLIRKPFDPLTLAQEILDLLSARHA